MSNDSLLSHPPHPEFGAFLVMRQRRGFYIFVAILLGVPCLLFIPGAIGCLLSALSGRPGGAGTAALMSGLSALMVAGCWFCIRKARTSHWFYELGALCQRGRRQVAIAYGDADRFQFAVTHQYHNGMYAGTVLKLRLLAPDKREITFGGPFKVKSKGLIKRKFEVKDELENVKQIIAQQMAVSVVDRILQGETVAWGNLYSMSSEGLTIVHGKQKGEMVPYLSFVGQDARDGKLRLFAKDEPKSAGGLSTGAVNFWPCYFAFLELTGMLQAVEAESAASASVDAPHET